MLAVEQSRQISERAGPFLSFSSFLPFSQSSASVTAVAPFREI